MSEGVRYLRVREVADRLRIDPRTVYRMLERGELDGVRTGRNWRIVESSLPFSVDTGPATSASEEDDCHAALSHDLENALVALRGLVDVLRRLDDSEHDRRRTIERRLTPLVDRVADGVARLARAHATQGPVRAPTP